MVPRNQVPQPQQLGQGLIGLVFGLSIYGVTLSQTFLYYRRFPDDTKGLKYLVFFLTVIDTFHMYLLCSVVWSTTVIGRSREPTTWIPMPWQLAVSFIISFSVISVVQSFFCLRIWRLTKRFRLITSAIAAAALGQLGGGIAFAASSLIPRPPIRFNQLSSVCIKVHLISSLLCDFLISCYLIYHFHAHRRGSSKKTQAILNKLIWFSVNQILSIGLVTIVTLVLLETTINVFLPLPSQPILCKLYINCLLAALNCRKEYREIAGREIELSEVLPHSAHR